MTWKMIALAALVALLSLAAASCSDPSPRTENEHADAAQAGDEHGHEEGPHGGRLLHADGLDLEITIFESGVPPQFRLYAYDEGRPIAPAEVQASITLSRLGGHTDRFSFAPQADYLVGDRTVAEPHSFDVAVTASRGEQSFDWTYESYEGRTTIVPAAAEAAGVEVSQAGPATLRETIELTGQVVLRPEARAEVRARYRGSVLAVTKTVGDSVRAGELLARVEAADSLQTYEIVAPIEGVVLERTTNVGDVAADDPLYVVADLSSLQAEFHVFPRDVARISAGQPVRIESLDAVAMADTTIASFLPTAEADTQTLLARALIDNPDGAFRPGMTVRGAVVVNEREAAVAVQADAIQRWREMDAVFTRVGDTYEVRPVLLGARDADLVEVLDGLAAGDDYVSANSFLIRADIEKAGAAHDH
jgi:cobalt-zinc-cadmium efflux system membrane fusion protein